MPREVISGRDADAIKAAFHAEHNRLYGYSLEEQGTPVEIINLRLQAVGVTDKPAYAEDDYSGADPAVALKGERAIYIPESGARETVPVYDGHKTRFGHRISGPAMIEQENTAILVSAAYDCVSDRYGSFALYLKGREDLVADVIEGKT